MGTVLVLTILGTTAQAAWASDHTVGGELTLSGDIYQHSCTGSGGYDDISAGTQVVVRDGNNHVIGTGRLGPGHGTSQLNRNDATLFDACTFKFKVKGVPETKFYSVEISHRGGLTYSLADMKKAKWKVHATLTSSS